MMWNYLLILFSLSVGNSQQAGTECNNGNGICTYTADCSPLVINFSFLYNHNKIKFCDRTNSIVCCPNKKEIETKQATSANELFSQVCENYYKTAFQQQCEPLPFVVSGSRVKLKEFPHIALVGHRDENRRINWFCGGTLISERFVLTAAHCLESLYTVNFVRLGELDHSTFADDAQTQDFSVSKIYKHPAYVEHTNDISLLQLNGKAILNQYVAPACLTAADDEQYESFLAAGWGAVGILRNSSAHLLKVQLERYNINECASTEQQQEVQRDRKSIICAGSRKDSRDTCQGDSGGPLFVEHADHRCMYLLLGVTSYGEFGCGGFSQHRPAVYQRVAFYADWIKSIVWNATNSNSSYVLTK